MAQQQPAQQTRDPTRAIVASLFTAPPGSAAPHPEQHVAHVQTFEGQEGTSERKARFLIISAVRDGRLKLHKAKENTNGTFSIGKTWGLEELRKIEVARRTVNTPAGAQSHPLEFTLTMNGKQYRYETEMPSAQQAAFLVKMVRCWRTYMAGRGQPDLVLVGFNVDNSNGTARPSTAPSGPPPPPAASRPPLPPLASTAPYTVPQPTTSSSTRENFPLSASTQSAFSNSNGSLGRSAGGPQSASASSSSFPRPSNVPLLPPGHDRQQRPSTAASNRTVASNYRQTPSPPPSSGVFPGRRPSLANLASTSAAAASTSSSARGPSPVPQARVISPPPARPLSSSNNFRNGSSNSGPPPPARPPSSGGFSSNGLRNGSGSGAPPARPPSSSGPSSSSNPTRNGSASVPPASSRGSGPRGENSGSFSSVNDQQPSSRTTTPTSRSRNGNASAPPRNQCPAFSEGIAPDNMQGRVSSASSVARPASQAAGPPPVGRPQQQQQQRRASPPPVDPGHSHIVAPQPRRPMPDVDDLVDDDTVLSNVEEMLEGFEWRSGAASMSGGYADGMRSKGKADEIERSLVGELKALEAASIHAIIESDDRVNYVVKHLDDALAELDKMEILISMYKSGLNLMADDISHIEGQNRGLQVQTSNQRALLSELDHLLETIHIPESDITALTQESLENPKGIERLEKAAVSLYKALLSTRDTAVGDMAAASERVGEYRTTASQFCKRIFDFIAIMFKFQVEEVSNPKVASATRAGQLPSHSTMEEFLGRYCGLMLFVKEIDYGRYQQICAAYFTAMSDLHRTEIQGLMTTLRGQIKKATDDELEASFSGSKESPTLRQQSMRRVGTVVRNPIDGGRGKDKDQAGKMSGSEAFNKALTRITPRVVREQGFISDFLAINALDASITFADYMSLETYFRRGAMSYLASQQGKLKDIRGAMDLVFGFLDAELKDWVDAIVRNDTMQIVGVMAALDRAIVAAEEARNEFLVRTYQKQYGKASTVLERSCKEQIKSIEQTKLTLKKRKGVVPFVRVFPLFVKRVESQLEGANALPIRGIIGAEYERMITTIFDSLQQMAKMDGEGQGVAAEDKDQLNYHVIIIENMHHIVTVFAKQTVPALTTFVSQAREKYTQNLDLYVKLILRRPLARLLDFFHGLEQLLRTTPPTEVALHGAYTKSALRRTLSDLRVKDLRKAIDVLYKRVDKHFGDVLNPSAEHTAVIKEVWKACEAEMQRLTAAWKGLIEKCYPDEKGGLDFSRDDVHDYFLKVQA